ncbi:hypothetical protein CLAFUR0_04110 [Fulvia fulva]|nr:hypothetical protein CLAFUR0_04110 [Fulvia fulva]
MAAWRALAVIFDFLAACCNTSFSATRTHTNNKTYTSLDMAITYTANQLLSRRYILTAASTPITLSIDLMALRTVQDLVAQRELAEAQRYATAINTYNDSSIDALWQRIININRGSGWWPLSRAATHARQQLTLRRNLREFNRARAAHHHQTSTLSPAERWALRRARNIRRQQQWQRRQARRHN